MTTCVILLAAASFILIVRLQDSEQAQARRNASKFNKTKYSVSEPGSIWQVVNKQRLLPTSYVPANLVTANIPLRIDPNEEQMHISQIINDQLKKMTDDAAKQGFKLVLASGYRSASYQDGLYNSYVADKGQAYADATSARPGASEHQTGLAVDLSAGDKSCELEKCFGETQEGKWLATNGYRYGFIVRYPQGKTNITGYDYEPWHLRYVGVPLATEMHKQKISTLEEFFGLPAAPDYK